MKLSARNQIPATVTDVTFGEATANVVLKTAAPGWSPRSPWRRPANSGSPPEVRSPRSSRRPTSSSPSQTERAFVDGTSCADRYKHCRRHLLQQPQRDRGRRARSVRRLRPVRHRPRAGPGGHPRLHGDPRDGGPSLIRGRRRSLGLRTRACYTSRPERHSRRGRSGWPGAQAPGQGATAEHLKINLSCVFGGRFPRLIAHDNWTRPRPRLIPAANAPDVVVTL